MRKFEYKIINIQRKGIRYDKVDLEDTEAILTGEGLIGWEVISTFDNNKGSKPELCFLMKREIIQE